LKHVFDRLVIFPVIQANSVKTLQFIDTTNTDRKYYYCIRLTAFIPGQPG